jgi:hypothetical protein
MRPIAHSSDQSMLHRIEMNVINVPLEVGLIADCVLPKATLPKPRFAIAGSHDHHTGLDDRSRKASFDQTQSIRKISVAIGQRHYEMQVVRQHHSGINCKRALAPCGRSGTAQRLDMIDKDLRCAVGNCRRNEECTAREEVPAISDHSCSLSRISLRSIRATGSVWRNTSAAPGCGRYCEARARRRSRRR